MDLVVETSEKRKRELLKAFDKVDEKDVVYPLINDVVFLEGQLSYLRTLPMIRIKKTDPSEQKATPASKMYKEMLQQYNNCIKILVSVLGRTGDTDNSPLRDFLGKLNGIETR